MALKKVPVSIDLIKGADTKKNEQIDKDSPEMENVVFTGDMTAKKMPGYDLLATLPPGEKYSAIFTRQNDLLFQTDKGSYKYFENIEEIRKIDSIGSSSVEKHLAFGEVVFSSDNYIIHVKPSQDIDPSSPTVIFYYMTYTFTDKQGNVINSLKIRSNVPGDIYDDPISMRWVIAVSNADDFFVTTPDANGDFAIRKFTYSSTTNAYSLAVTFSLTGLTYASIQACDIFIDSSEVIFGIKRAAFTTGYKLYRLNYLTLAQTHSIDFYADAGAMVNAWTSFYIFNRDASTIYITASINGGDGNTSFLVLSIYNKSDITFVSSSITQSRLAYPSLATLHYLPYVTSDTTTFCMAYEISRADNTGTASYSFSPTQLVRAYYNSGLLTSLNFSVSQSYVMPISRIFIENGEYYFFGICQSQLDSVFHLIRVKDGVSVAVFNHSKRAYSSSEHLFKFWNLYWRNSTDWYSSGMRNPFKIDTEWFIGVRSQVQYGNIYGQHSLYGVDLDARKINSSIEIERDSHIFNGQPAFYDGSDLSEYGFNSVPMITNFRNSATSTVSIPAGTYQFVAMYRWKDSSGDVFYSGLSNITAPFAYTNTGGNTHMVFDMYLPLITTKNNVEILVFIKKDSDQFRLYNTYFYSSIDSSSYRPVDITFYPSTDPIYLPYSGTFVAGGDYPPEVLTGTIAASLHDDRIFNISKDNQISVAFSQVKIAGYGPEFNPSIFYSDVFNKRPSEADSLVALASMDGKLIIFHRNSISYQLGYGPSRANTNNDFSTPQLIAADVGCVSQKSVVLMPFGVMFKSEKGIYLISRGLDVKYLGSPVEKFNDLEITSAILLDKVNEVRFTTLEGYILVYNYYSDQWSWFNNLPSRGACIWKGKYVLMLANGKIYVESQAHHKIVEGATSTPIVQKITTPWIRRGEAIQEWEKVYRSLILGFYKTPHQMKLEVYYDYEKFVSEEYVIDPLSEGDYNTTTRPTNEELENGTKTNGVYQLMVDMIRKNCQAFRMVITDIAQDIDNNTGECFALSNITVTIGIKKGVAKLPAAKSY